MQPAEVSWMEFGDVADMFSGTGLGLSRTTSHRIVRPAPDPVMHTANLWGGHIDMPPAELERALLQAVRDDPSLLHWLGRMDIFYNPCASTPGEGTQGALNYFLLAAPGTDGLILPETTIEPTTRLLERAGLSEAFGNRYAVLFLREDTAQREGVSVEESTYTRQLITINTDGSV